MDSKTCKVVRTVVARLDAGEDLLLSLTKLAEGNNIKAGWFNIIGGLKKIVYGLYEDGKYKNITKEARHCFELLPTAGNVSIKEGKVLIHAHINATDEEDGTAYGGHLMEGTLVYPFAEVVLYEVDVELGRIFDPKTNLWPMKFIRS